MIKLQVQVLLKCTTEGIVQLWGKKGKPDIGTCELLRIETSMHHEALRKLILDAFSATMLC